MIRAKEYMFEGELLTVAEIGARLGVAPNVLRERLRAGEPPERAFSGRRRGRKYEYKGRELTLRQIAGESGIPFKTLSNAVYSGSVKPEELEAYIRKAMMRRVGRTAPVVMEHKERASEAQMAAAIAAMLFNDNLLQEAGFRETQKGAYEFGAELCRYVLRMLPGGRAELRAYCRETGGCMMRRDYEIRDGVVLEARA